MDAKSAMTKPMAAFALMEMMRGNVTSLQAEALQIAVNNLCKRHYDEQTAVEEMPLEGYAKFLTVGKGVTLVRFAGKDTVHLAARRKGTDGNPNALFTIDVSKVTKSATVKKDGKTLFAMDAPGCNYSRLEKLAISALHRWFHDQRPCASRRRRAKKAKLAAMETEVAE